MEPPRQDPPTDSALEMRASPAAAGSSTAGGAAPERRELPPIHQRLARPETREEYFHGQLRFKMPSNPPHARQHIRLAYVLEAHVAEGYLGAVEMLTRTGSETDFAPDASVYPQAPDPTTGERQLEELAFEVCSEQSLEVPTTKARDLVGRGVRRVFCIVVGGGSGQRRRRSLEASYLLEWSPPSDGWARVPEDAVIEDPCLDPPLPVAGLLEATAGDQAVAQALRARGNPVFAEERARGQAEAHAKNILTVLESRGLAASDEDRRRILECQDLELLQRWFRRSLGIAAVDDLWDPD
jgi:hypothetical protein